VAAATSPVEVLNSLSDSALRSELLECCGSSVWAREVAARRPFNDAQDVLSAADAAWSAMDDYDWREAFDALGEQPSADGDEGTRNAANVALTLYRQRFGLPFVSAARNSMADELLMRVRIRLGNDAATEWKLACDEQRRATRLRLNRLLTGDA
jgi:2-oxo-4-hydroxy-4-carboxy--5-ureidoimidazoline (OHCU) decarboxylase